MRNLLHSKKYIIRARTAPGTHCLCRPLQFDPCRAHLDKACIARRTLLNGTVLFAVSSCVQATPVLAEQLPAVNSTSVTTKIWVARLPWPSPQSDWLVLRVSSRGLGFYSQKQGESRKSWLGVGLHASVIAA